jgi:(p)ppGpp synthase/HD superfamily hydrolase
VDSAADDPLAHTDAAVAIRMRLDGGRGPIAVDALADASEALDEAYRGVRTKAGKGAEHAREVAGILRAAGYPEFVQVAGLLHDVVEDTPWTIEQVAERFGPGVAGVVGALTEDDEIDSYRRRKRALREQIAAAGAPATDVALADKIASLRHLRLTGRRLPKRKRAHYEATLAIAAATARAELASEVADLLEALAERDEPTSGRA